MTLDPEEFVTLTDHGSMKLRAAVSRAMTLLPKERKRTTIVREGEPATLQFRADQKPCGAVGRTARANRLTGLLRWFQSGRALPKRRPVHSPVTPTDLT